MMVEFHLGKSAALVRSAQMISLEAEISTETEVSLAKVVRVVFAFPLDNVVFIVMFFDFGFLTTGAWKSIGFGGKKAKNFPLFFYCALNDAVANLNPLNEMDQSAA